MSGADQDAYRLAFESCPVAMFHATPEGTLTAWNTAAEGLFGWPAGEVLGRPFPAEVVRGPPLAEVLRAAAESGASPPPAELAVRARDGGVVEVAVLAHAVRGPGGALRHLAALARDVGPRRRAQELREGKLQELQVILDAIPVAVFYKDARGIYQGCNKAFEAMMGRPRDRIVGLGVEGLAPPELARIYRAADDALFQAGGTQVYEARVRHADGTTRDVIFNKAVYRDGAGRPALVGTVLDITERKRAEQALATGSRLAALGTLAAGVAHEVNNALAYTVTSLGFVREHVERGAPPDVREALAEVGDGVARVSRIVQELGGFSRVDDAVTAVDLERVVRSAAHLAQEALAERATLRLEVGGVPPVLGHAPSLGQVFLNLLHNAVQAMPDRPREANEVSVTARAQGETVEVQVRDNGVGIPPGVRDRLFEPFFTTRPAGTATGLGLATCQRIVAGLGGEIAVESEAGVGTVVRVVLPVADPGALGRGEEVPGDADLAPALYRVLVVDDEPENGRKLERLLRPHTVVAEVSARAALARLERGERFDVVFCDLVMPEMDGVQLFEELRRAHPDAAARTLFMTSAFSSLELELFLGSVRNRRVFKPFDAAELRRALQAVAREHPAGAPRRTHGR